MIIPIEVSARHIHISKKDFITLFGKNEELKEEIILSQKKEFASSHFVTLVGPKNKIKNVRILGPFRDQTQIEISVTDSFFLGLKAPFRISGDIKDSGSAVLTGPKGKLELDNGLIVPLRHLHISSDDALKNDITPKSILSVKISGPRSLTFNNIIPRIKPEYSTSLHIDTDEGNAAAITNKTSGELIIEK